MNIYKFLKKGEFLGIEIGMTQKKLYKSMKEHNFYDSQIINFDDSYYIRYEGIEIGVREDKVSHFNLHPQEYPHFYIVKKKRKLASMKRKKLIYMKLEKLLKILHKYKIKWTFYQKYSFFIKYVF